MKKREQVGCETNDASSDGFIIEVGCDKINEIVLAVLGCSCHCAKRGTVRPSCDLLLLRNREGLRVIEDYPNLDMQNFWTRLR